jgi:hypothetical protein
VTAEEYNPILRTFHGLRAGLTHNGAIARHHVHPEAPLEMLLPVQGRRIVWQQLRQRGLRVPALELSPRASTLNALGVLRMAISFALWLQHWLGLSVAIPVGLVVWWVSRPYAVHFPLGVRTVGEMVIHMTRFGEHKHSGYRWTENEISTKVRLTLAECLNHRLEAVRPESTLAELGAD